MAVFLLKGQVRAGLRASAREGRAACSATYPYQRVRRRLDREPLGARGDRGMRRGQLLSPQPGDARPDGRLSAQGLDRRGLRAPDRQRRRCSPMSRPGAFDEASQSRTCSPAGSTGGCLTNPLRYCPNNNKQPAADGGVHRQSIRAPMESAGHRAVTFGGTRAEAACPRGEDYLRRRQEKKKPPGKAVGSGYAPSRFCLTPKLYLSTFDADPPILSPS